MQFVKILSSRLGQKVLAFFFSHETEEFYLRELASKIDEDPANLAKLMKLSVKLGLFSARTKGKEKYFKLNRNYPLYLEIKGFLDKTIGIKARLASAVRNLSGLKQAFIYGSWVRGDVTASSDLDLFLVGKIDENKLLLILKRLEKEFGREVNYLLLTEREFKDRIKEDSFVKSITNDSKIDLL
jgi:predicted nucleotidyltransferase